MYSHKGALLSVNLMTKNKMIEGTACTIILCTQLLELKYHT